MNGIINFQNKANCSIIAGTSVTKKKTAELCNVSKGTVVMLPYQNQRETKSDV